MFALITTKWFLKKLLFIGLLVSVEALGTNKKIDYWRSVPRGTNMATTNPETDFNSAFKHGIRLVRFGATGSPSDFRYLVQGENPNDTWDLSEGNISLLKASLKRASRSGLKIVVSLAHIPGRAWKFRERDNRIWNEQKYQDGLVKAWSKLAEELRDDENVVAYDILNEPYLPKGNIHKLWTLYRRCISAIRSVDHSTPIIVESPAMASPDTVVDFPIFEDSVIYSFHYYEPFPYFAPPINKGKLSYPGLIVKSHPIEGDLIPACEGTRFS